MNLRITNPIRMYESKKKPIRTDLVYPDLSYELIGILFDVYNELGFGYHERHYQKATSEILKERGIKFKEQVYMPLNFRNKVIGKYFLDFLVEDKIILEIKKNERFSKKHIDQVNNYLKFSRRKLAILINFGSDGVKFKRLVNI